MFRASNVVDEGLRWEGARNDLGCNLDQSDNSWRTEFDMETLGYLRVKDIELDTRADFSTS